MNPKKTKFRKPNPIFTPFVSPIIESMTQPMIIQRPFRTTGKRPVDKIMISANKTTVDGTQVATVLLLVTFPCTIVGLRWNGVVRQDAGTGPAFHNWAIVVLRQGVTVSTMASGDGNTFFTPESNCLVLGVGSIDNNVESQQYEGSTKTMRKMQGGDQLLFICSGSATNTSAFNFVVQFFCKT